MSPEGKSGRFVFGKRFRNFPQRWRQHGNSNEMAIREARPGLGKSALERKVVCSKVWGHTWTCSFPKQIAEDGDKILKPTFEDLQTLRRTALCFLFLFLC